MRAADFDFALPEENIALRPAEPRDSARMLVVRPSEAERIHDSSVSMLASFLRGGDALVFNDTRVIPAQLSGHRLRGTLKAGIDVTLHKRESGSQWRAFARPGKRLQPGDALFFEAQPDDPEPLRATVRSKYDEGDFLIEFDVAPAELDQALARVGRLPLPPYIASKRAGDERDITDYQTVYARHEGAVAAPTAGLHFTPNLLDSLDAAGISTHYLTLHVGAGTFLPVKAATLSDHRMHAEWGSVSPETAAALNGVRRRGGRIVAVGTTSLRLLESASAPQGEILPFGGDTEIFITPGYRFKAVDILMTNFHLPKSTLFMLVSAFAGVDMMREAYGHAISAGYRFYSYGDASLLFRG
jgi:S-adenosylmethionine:tRNA ribosyltransferase-isomerase